MLDERVTIINRFCSDMRALDRIVARMRKHAREKPTTIDRLIVKFLINVKRVSTIFANSRLRCIKEKKKTDGGARSAIRLGEQKIVNVSVNEATI